MLSVPQLDDLSYQKLFERARSRIPAITEEWTDFNAHDPGITTLQTFAWLSDTLNYYMDATGEAHLLKYYKLLGIRPERTAASCTVQVNCGDDEYIIPRGTRMAAGNVVFETQQTFTGRTNRVEALYRITGENVLDITHLAGMDGGYAELFSYENDQHPQLYIGMEKPMEDRVQLYIQVQKNPRRNPFDSSFHMVGLEWEYYDGSHWQQAYLAEDETCGFLRSGFVTLILGGTSGLMENSAFEPAHYLRCTLAENGYDLLPFVGTIAPCSLEAVQTDTRAQAFEYVYEGGEEMPIDYCIQPDDAVTVAVESENGYETWFEHRTDRNALCSLKDGRYPWQKVICFDGEKPLPGQKILILITSAYLYPQLMLGSCCGCAEERIEFSMENVKEIQLAMVTQKEGCTCYEIWNQCEDLDQAGYDEKVFRYDARTEEVVFGDGIHGMQPPTGAQVRAVTVKCSLFENGNVLAGQLNRLVSDLQEDISIVNLEAAENGKTCSSPDQLEQKLADKLNHVSRAVTVEDYRRIVQETPGLMIDKVNVITGKEYAACYGTEAKPNTVLLAVKPHSHEPHARLEPLTAKLIRQNLEQYRLLTTNVELIGPRYVGIQVFGRIALKENKKACRQAVRDRLTELIDFSGTGGFGQSIACGRVFSALEMLDCVGNVIELSFEVVGKGAVKNERGDIQVFPDALTFVRSIEIEFV